MTILSVGQCLTSYSNEYAISAVNMTEGKISYTILGMNNPTLSNVPEASLRFYRLSDRVLPLEEVRRRRSVVQAIIDKNEAEKMAALEKRHAAEKSVKNNPDNAGLLTVDDESNTTKLAAKNIRLLLKKHFPGVKFSVRMRDYNAIYVSWTDGATKAAVEAIIDHFQEGHFNGMEDIYEYNDCAFNRVYGGVKYLFCERSHSDELIAEAITKLRSRFGEHAVPADITPAEHRKGALWNRNLNCFANGLQAEINKQAADIDKSKR